MRNWNRLSLMLPAGLAIAALYVPFRLVFATTEAPLTVQAAVEAPARQTPHFFPGNASLSGFQRLVMPETGPSQLSGVTVLPVPGVEVPVVAEPTVAKTALEEHPQVEKQEQQDTQRPAVADSSAKATTRWNNPERHSPHFFPNKLPSENAVVLAGFEQQFAPTLPSPTPRLRPAEVLAAAAPKIKEPPITSPVPKANSPVPAIAFEDQALRGPHFFVGSTRMASLDRQSALRAPPLKQVAVQSVVAPELPPSEEPAKSVITFASQPINRPEAVPLPQAAIVSLPVMRPELVKPKEQETGLSNAGDFRLQSTEVAALPNGAPFIRLPKPELTSLANPGSELAGPLVPAEVFPAAAFPAASPTPFREEFRLASLQSQMRAPAANLQPTEVNFQTTEVNSQPPETLPVPAPSGRVTPRIPAIDVDRPISAVTTRIAQPTGKLPTDLAVDQFRGDYPAYLPRGWEDTVYFWDAPSMCIGPLRYEEVNLERYGYSHNPIVQPALSGMHFLAATLALPYNMAVRPPGTCMYPLGHYRPGSAVPFRHIWPEPSFHGATSECLAVAGLILLIP